MATYWGGPPTSMGIKAKGRPNKYKEARYSIGNVSMKDLSKIIREFENRLIKVMIVGVPTMIPLTVTFA